MTIAAISGVVGGSLCLFAAVNAALVAAAVPEWREDVGRFRWIALTAAGAVLCNVPNTLQGLAPAWSVWGGRVQLAFLCLHGAAWLHDLEARAGRGRPVSPGVAAFGAAGLLALVPGAVYSDAWVPRPVPWLGVVYRDVQTSAAGTAYIAAMSLAAAALVGRAWRRPEIVFPRGYRWTAAFLVAALVHDALATVGVPLPTPYLMDFAFAPVILALSALLTQQAARDFRALRTQHEGLERAVRHRTRALEAAQQRLLRSERLAALGQFSAAVAHEVNNPAAVIGANLDFLAEAGLGEEAREAVAESRGALARVVHLTRQLLQAGRTAAAPQASISSVALGEAAHEAIRAVMARHGGAAVDVGYEGAPGLTARTDAAALVQVITNLVSNGVQAIPEGRRGRVAVRAERAGAVVVLTVEDDGVGMSAETLDRLFEPFYSTKPRGAGTGLGLAVCRSLAMAMGGELTFESAPGRGTRARLEFCSAEDEAAAAAPPPPPLQRTPGADVRPLRILVVDDDPAVRAALARALAARHAVDAVGTVDAALTVIPGGLHDLILCDVMMPDGGGERVWREVSARLPDRAARMVFITGGAATPESRAFLEAQPRPVLEKPLDLEALHRVARRLGLG